MRALSLIFESGINIKNKIERAEISPREVLGEYREWFEKTDQVVCAFIRETFDRAEKQAQKLEEIQVRGEELPHLAGVPVGIKDNLAWEGLPMTCASHMLQDFDPGYSATVVHKLEEAGALIIGKTNLDEFAMGSTSEKSAFFPTHNPHKLDCVPGGSSGGSAACVASGLAPLALGSDTGGSVRQPAAFCGIFGLRPTFGRISRYGMVAFASSLDQVGPMARNLEDLELLFKVISGKDQKDPTTFDEEVIESKGEWNLKKLKIAFPRELTEEMADPEVSEKVKALARKLEENGARLEEISLPLLNETLAAYHILGPTELSSNLGRLDGIRYGRRIPWGDDWEEIIRKTRGEFLGSEAKRRILLGALFLTGEYRRDYYQQAKKLRSQLKKEFDRLFSDFDLLLLPVAPTAAFERGKKELPPGSYTTDIFTVPASLTGLPALALPAGKDSRGLPLSLQLMGPVKGESVLFGWAKTIVKTLGLIAEIPELAKKGGN